MFKLDKDKGIITSTHKVSFTKLGFLHSVMVRYNLDKDFEEKIARFLELEIMISNGTGLMRDEQYEYDDLKSWFDTGDWRYSKYHNEP